MRQFPAHITFCYPWRSYQQRILDQLEQHLRTRHLHLVAPPGSGKTVLGLEVMLRMNQPTLIVAPTLTIKQQWADRFTELFLQTKERPDWLSTSLKQPGFVTVTTYQALHSLYKNEADGADEGADAEVSADGELEQPSEDEDLAPDALSAIRQMGFRTLILDEAHHLRTAWWRSTLKFRKELERPALIALTATPPYDVQPREWQRYEELCGPIDAEISVPELVREGELCPHQDYIYLSTPDESEAGPLRAFRAETSRLRDELLQQQELIRQLAEHPWIREPEQHLEAILAAPAYYSSIAIFLRATGRPEWEGALQILGMKAKQMPALDEEWLEELLTGVLYQDEQIDTDHAELKTLAKQLNRMGAVERRKVYLRSTPSFDRSLVHSASKLSSIERIVGFEKEQLGPQLRMVILSDYIRREDMPKSPEDMQPLSRLGVVPVFELIRRRAGGLEPAILTGSLVVLPLSALPVAQECAAALGLQLHTRPLPHDPAYLALEVRDANRSQMVAIMTEVFTRGGVHILIGTAALLGEGWDAPSINSLILASYVGSFMLSNQMRGRAIRTERGNPGKASAIWHLACVDSGIRGGGQDLEALGRRFRSLVGLSIDGETIESGIARMGMDQEAYPPERIAQLNWDTLERAKRRGQLHEKWLAAIALGGGMAEELLALDDLAPRPLIYGETIKALLITALGTFIGVILELLSEYRLLQSDMPWWLTLLLALSLGVLIGGFWLVRAARLAIRHRSLESSMRQVGWTVYATLYDMELVQEEPSLQRIGIEEQDGVFACWLKGGTTQEQTVFLEALRQVLEPIDNPRYLLYRESRGPLGKRRDYHALPEVVGRRKIHAEQFLAHWQKKVDPAALVYTRTPEGRRVLLTARGRAMSAHFQTKSERISAWR
ncbi:DEAD/DEAH box helicase family protein [Paenibacillus daejeonensis]|uniref:DEAD/DEAH box helicase family protein n=1 Tax=Paenibacillus daejeonensis TaxID=135193 RepID=UPI000371203E|nr:DEAD/DEAH box helicase family protein [Paenibacillus daejeonensis]